MEDRTLKIFYEDYLKALEEGYGAVFAGAGLSKPAGFVDWKELLRDVAEDLGLDVEMEDDLIALAQYHLNTHDNRARLNKNLIDEFLKDSKPTENHQLLARLPMKTVWTTNYDTLIEDAFKEAGKRVEIKKTQENLSLTLPDRDVTIYKMHGDISLPHEAVLTKEDYETYNDKRQLFTEMLKGDLISKTFLFLGFSFTDPNIDYILSRIRSLMGQNIREHFCIMKRLDRPKTKGEKLAEYEYEKTKLELRIGDLKRYGIRALMIDDYKEIREILEKLNLHAHRKNVFVSGSADEFGKMPRSRIENLSKRIGSELMNRGYNLISGFGLGIGSAVLIGALEERFNNDKVSSERITMRPFPQASAKGIPPKKLRTKYREEIISNAGFTIFICGNKFNARKKQIIQADGVLEEFEIAKSQGKFPIPIGATDYAAEIIWKEVMNNLSEFYPKGGVKKYFEILGKSDSTDEQIIEAIFSIMKSVVPK